MVAASGAAMNFAAIIRIAAILLGIMSALALARDGLGLRLFPFVDAIVTTYGLLLDDLFLDMVLAIFEPALNLVKVWLDWNWSLHPHWKHAFVLLWLLFSSAARTSDGLGNRFWWVWGGVCALLTSVLAGTAPLSDPLVFYWPLAGFLLFASVRNTDENIGTLYRKRLPIPPFAGVAKFLAAITLFLLLILLLTLIPIGLPPIPFFANSPSPGLATLTAFAAMVGMACVIAALIMLRGEGSTFLQKWLGDPNARLGLDILSVLGGAAAIVYLARLMA